MMNPIDEIIRNEGGFTAHASDKGNYYRGKLVGTNYGITGATLAAWLKRDVSMEDVKNLTEEEAREIYETRYLSGPRIHTLPDPPQTCILDIAVNSGPKTGIIMLQKVLNKAGFGPVDTDGVLGPQTRNKCIEAQNAMGPYLQNAIVDERVAFYNRIVQRDSSQRVFLKGWLRRAESFRLSTSNNATHAADPTVMKYLKEVPSEVANIILEMIPMLNNNGAIALVQKTVNMTGLVSIKVDGHIGPNTVNAIKAVSAHMGASVLAEAIDEEWQKT